MKCTKETIKNHIIHCPTEQEFHNVQKKFFKLGFEWPVSGKKFCDSYWTSKGSDAAIYTKGVINIDTASIETCKEEHPSYTCITAKQFLDGKIILPKPPKFLLKYDLDTDPIEEFETLAEVKKRIQELHKEHRDTLHNIVVYEIKSKKEIEIEKTIKIKNL